MPQGSYRPTITTPHRRPSPTVAATLVLLLAPALASAQQFVVRDGPEDGFVLRELAAVMVPDDDGEAARVEHVMPAEERVEAYKDVDLRAGDRVLAANGKRVRSAKELQAAYDALAIGAEVALGIERGAAATPERKIVRFAKVDPATMPAPQMRMVMIQGGGDGEPGNIEVMPALGAVLRQGEEKDAPIVVAAVLPGGEGRLRDGDRVVSINGEKVADLPTFAERWDAIAVGAELSLGLENAGKERTERFAKPAAPAGRRVIRQ